MHYIVIQKTKLTIPVYNKLNKYHLSVYMASEEQLNFDLCMLQNVALEIILQTPDQVLPTDLYMLRSPKFNHYLISVIAVTEVSYFIVAEIRTYDQSMPKLQNDSIPPCNEEDDKN